MQEDSAPQHPTTYQVPAFFTAPLLRYFFRLGKSGKDVMCKYEYSSLAIKHPGYFQLRSSAPDYQEPLCITLCISLQQGFDTNTLWGCQCMVLLISFFFRIYSYNLFSFILHTNQFSLLPFSHPLFFPFYLLPFMPLPFPLERIRPPMGMHKAWHINVWWCSLSPYMEVWPGNPALGTS